MDFPTTEKENKHILTIVDQFTKFIVLYPIPDRTAKTAAKFIYDFILKFGIPLKLLSDQDPAYESKLFDDVDDVVGGEEIENDIL